MLRHQVNGNSIRLLIDRSLSQSWICRGGFFCPNRQKGIVMKTPRFCNRSRRFNPLWLEQLEDRRLLSTTVTTAITLADFDNNGTVDAAVRETDTFDSHGNLLSRVQTYDNDNNVSQLLENVLRRFAQ